MNILQLVPKLNIGGVEKGTIEVARYLSLNGHKAVVVSGGGVMEKQLAAIGARHYKIPVGRKDPFSMIYSYFSLKRIIKKENIDIVHGRSRIPALTGYFAAKKTHKIFITTAHGQYRKHFISQVMGWGRIVIAANDTMARYMKENFGVPLRKIRIIPRGVDLEKFSFVPHEGKQGKAVKIGMICRFTPLKGHLDFLKAASYISRRMHNVEVILMGDRSSAKEEYMKKIDLTIRRLMLGTVVKFKDSTESVADVMKDLDIFVSANREQEAFGRSIIEAQARGVPVVATRVGGVVETIIDGKTGLLCEPMDPSDMAEKVTRYIEDRELMKNVAVNARKNVEEKYSLSRTMRITLETYADVLSTKNILIIKISSLGDIILATPSIRAIRKRFPKACIKVLVDVRFREALKGCPYIDDVITCDLAGRDSGVRLARLVARLRSEDFDISVDLQNNRKSHLLSFLSTVPERYGFDNGKWSFFLNRRISLPKKPMDPIAHQGCVLGLLGITKPDKALELFPDDSSCRWVDEFLKNNWLKKDQQLVALSLAASRKWRTKNWGISPMVELADILAREKAIRVVIVGSDEDREDADEFIRRSGAKPIDAVGKTSILQLAALIRRCNALVTGDSAPMHVASAMGVPFVAIFGPTDPDRHFLDTKNGMVLRKKMKCSPCYRPSCMKRKTCMNTIKPNEVYEALMEVMEIGVRS